MPLITIDVMKGRSEAELRTLLDTVHEAMVEAFGVPDSDRYQILTEHEPHQLKIINSGCYRNGPNSRPVLARKPTRSPERYCIRLSRVFTSAVSSAMVCLVRLA